MKFGLALTWRPRRMVFISCLVSWKAEVLEMYQVQRLCSIKKSCMVITEGGVWGGGGGAGAQSDSGTLPLPRATVASARRPRVQGPDWAVLEGSDPRGDRPWCPAAPTVGLAGARTA